MTPRLTVVTACYNHAHYLRECIDSVRCQTAAQDIEHIIINDASTDDSRKVAERSTEFDDRVLIVNNATTRGLAASLNRGISLASSPWVMKVDADDRIAPTYVEEILRAADDAPSRNIIFSPAQHFGTRSDVYTYPAFDRSEMIDTLMIAGCAAMRVELWDAVGGYDETMRFAEDWDLHIRAQLAVGLVPHQLSHPLWFYRKHGPSASTAGIAAFPLLREYWKGHTTENIGRRTWGAWCAERQSAVLA